VNTKSHQWGYYSGSGPLLRCSWPLSVQLRAISLNYWSPGSVDVRMIRTKKLINQGTALLERHAEDAWKFSVCFLCQWFEGERNKIPLLTLAPGTQGYSPVKKFLIVWQFPTFLKRVVSRIYGLVVQDSLTVQMETLLSFEMSINISQSAQSNIPEHFTLQMTRRKHVISIPSCLLPSFLISLNLILNFVNVYNS
jgi:hypothetical protein